MFVFFCLLAMVVNIVWYSWWYGITPTPTAGKVKKQILNILPSVPEGIIVELGSGWGTLAFALAEHFPNHQVIGYEISLFPYVVSKIRSLFFGYSNIKFVRKDFFFTSLENISLAVCYLYPGAMIRLRKKFECEMRRGSYVLSHTFVVPGWTPIRVEYAKDMYHTPIYLYWLR